MILIQLPAPFPDVWYQIFEKYDNAKYPTWLPFSFGTSSTSISSNDTSKGDIYTSWNTKEGSSTILYPGRFYILNYKSKTDKRYNSRPVIISLGLSEKDPNSYLCIDLCFVDTQPTGRHTMSFIAFVIDNFNHQTHT